MQNGFEGSASFVVHLLLTTFWSVISSTNKRLHSLTCSVVKLKSSQAIIYKELTPVTSRK
jgi:hypothetical protein